MDAIYPGTFNLSKVKWGAKFDYEYVENYKVLQNAFDKNGIKKHIDVNNNPIRAHDGHCHFAVQYQLLFSNN